MNALHRISRNFLEKIGFIPAKSPAVTMQVAKADLARFLPEDPLIVEAGAYRGQDTIEMAQQWPKGKIHAFEPVPALFDELKKNTASFSNVQVWPYALAAESGRRWLHLSSGGSDGSSSLMTPARHREFHPQVDFRSQIEVEAVNLDDWALRHEIDRVDFLWLDLQGGEPAVLRSAPRTLCSARAVHAEVSLEVCYEGTELYAEFRTWMEMQHFVVTRELLPYPDMGNVLFVRKS